MNIGKRKELSAEQLKQVAIKILEGDDYVKVKGSECADTLRRTERVYKNTGPKPWLAKLLLSRLKITKMNTCDKRSFETKNEALKANSECNYRKQKGSLHKKPCKAYQCRQCGKFHLTSEDLRNPKTPKKNKIRIEKEVKRNRQNKIKW